MSLSLWSNSGVRMIRVVRGFIHRRAVTPCIRVPAAKVAGRIFDQGMVVYSILFGPQ